jgi:hypothetical protein
MNKNKNESDVNIDQIPKIKKINSKLVVNQKELDSFNQEVKTSNDSSSLYIVSFLNENKEMVEAYKTNNFEKAEEKAIELSREYYVEIIERRERYSEVIWTSPKDFKPKPTLRLYLYDYERTNDIYFLSVVSSSKGLAKDLINNRLKQQGFSWKIEESEITEVEVGSVVMRHAFLKKQ